MWSEQRHALVEVLLEKLFRIVQLLCRHWRCGITGNLPYSSDNTQRLAKKKNTPSH
jgi:hypothetical protein